MIIFNYFCVLSDCLASLPVKKDGIRCSFWLAFKIFYFMNIKEARIFKYFCPHDIILLWVEHATIYYACNLICFSQLERLGWIKNINVFYILGRIRIDKRMVQGMVNAYTFFRIETQTFAEKIKARFAQTYICRELYVACIYIVYQFILVTTRERWLLEQCLI
jgi:hypothetical protein